MSQASEFVRQCTVFLQVAVESAKALDVMFGAWFGAFFIFIFALFVLGGVSVLTLTPIIYVKVRAASTARRDKGFTTVIESLESVNSVLVGIVLEQNKVISSNGLAALVNTDELRAELDELRSQNAARAPDNGGAEVTVNDQNLALEEQNGIRRVISRFGSAIKPRFGRKPERTVPPNESLDEPVGEISPKPPNLLDSRRDLRKETKS